MQINLKHPLFIAGGIFILILFLSFIASKSKKNNLNTVIDRHCKNLFILLKKKNQTPIQQLSQHICILTMIKSLKTMTTSKQILKQYKIDIDEIEQNSLAIVTDIENKYNKQ